MRKYSVFTVIEFSREEQRMKLWKSLLATALAVIMAASMAVCAFAYTDVPEDNAYYEYVNLVDNLGLITANKMGDFSPKNYFTKGDALITAYRLIYGSDEGLEDFITNETLFDDVDATHPISPYVCWAYDNNLITNDLAEKNFGPADPISGAEFLTLFVKVGNINPNASYNMGGMMPFSAEGEADGDADGEGTVTSDLIYPDSYINAAMSFAGDVMGDEQAITREMAAMTIAQLLWYQDENTSIDLNTLENSDGTPLDCLATNVYGLSKVDLTIRATADRPMGYDFEGDVLLSNGSVLTTEENLSKYIGHPITVTYRDLNRSGTLTEDEQIVSYLLNSMMVLSLETSEITMTNYTEFLVNTIGMIFYITAATDFYYNDEVWDEDPFYNLITIAGGTNKVIEARPNMEFTVVPSNVFCPETNKNLVMEVFVEEHHPAKIVDITDGTYTLYDYYARGTEDEYVSFSLNDLVFETSSTAEGDYVNFYVSSGKCHLLDGSAIKTKVKNVTGNVLTLESGMVLTPHQLFKPSVTPLEPGAEVVIITEDVDGSYYLGWEYAKTMEKTAALILSYTENIDSVTYHVFDCATRKEMDIEVPTDNIHASTRIEEGEFIYYSADAAGAYEVVRAKISEKVHLGVETKDYFVESTTGTEYKKSPGYYGNMYSDTFKADYYKMVLDVSGDVLALI